FTSRFTPTRTGGGSMLNATLAAELREAYLAGGVDAAAELSRARGLDVPTGAELSDLELELVAGGKDVVVVGGGGYGWGGYGWGGRGCRPGCRDGRGLGEGA